MGNKLMNILAFSTVEELKKLIIHQDAVIKQLLKQVSPEENIVVVEDDK